MKIKNRYKNSENNITYNLFELANGVKLIYLNNPSSIDFDIALIHKAGSIYEEIENVPRGTAHMLEHILFRPNEKFNAMDEIYEFESGTKEYPAIYMNGRTTHKYIYLTGHTNENGTERLLDRLDTIVNFNKQKLSEDFVTEKDIVLAERSRNIPTEKDKYLQYLKYIDGKVFPEFVYPILGEKKDIDSITMDDLEKYFYSRFVKENLVIAVQSNKLKKSVIKKIEELSTKYPNHKSKELNKREYKNFLNYGSFVDERLTGTSIFFSYFEDDPEGIDYKKEALDAMLGRLIRKVGEEKLRDKDGLVYGVDMGQTLSITLGYLVAEIALTVENSKIKEVFSAYDNFLFKDLEEFLNSTKGDTWFLSILSVLLYPHTPQFDYEKAENSAKTYIGSCELYNSNKYRKALTKIKKKDLLAKIKELQSIPPHIWIESNEPSNKVEEIVKESTFYKRFK